MTGQNPYLRNLESHIIKVQYNCLSDNKIYSNQNFIPIKHEHLLIFKKNRVWLFSKKETNTLQINIMEVTNITWRDLIQATLEFMRNRASIDEIYNILIKSKKAQNNNHVREKIRQTLNNNSNFKKVDNEWMLCIKQKGDLRMKNVTIDELYDKIERLEYEKMAYLEVNDKAGARRMARQIEQIELQIDISNYNKIKQELEIYKKVVRNYPGLQLEIKNKLTEQKII